MTSTLISRKAFLKSFCRGQPLHKSVNVSFVITNVKDRLRDLCANRLLQNDFRKTLHAIKCYGEGFSSERGSPVEFVAMEWGGERPRGGRGRCLGFHPPSSRRSPTLNKLTILWGD